MVGLNTQNQLCSLAGKLALGYTSLTFPLPFTPSMPCCISSSATLQGRLPIRGWHQKICAAFLALLLICMWLQGVL